MVDGMIEAFLGWIRMPSGPAGYRCVLLGKAAALKTLWGFERSAAKVFMQGEYENNYTAPLNSRTTQEKSLSIQTSQISIERQIKSC